MSSSRSLAVLLAFMVGGCPRASESECVADRECAPDICASDRHCSPLADVREVMVTWTVNGGDANAMTCARRPELTLTFLGDTPGDEVGFTPVPCSIGQFFLNYLPNRFQSVEIDGLRIPIASDGTARGDLRL